MSKRDKWKNFFFRILLPFLINILVPQIWPLFVMSSALQYLIQWSVMVCLRSILHECMKSSISQQRKYITLLNNPKFFRDLMLWIFQHITEDMVRITSTSTHFRDLFSGKEGDLPVGFSDRFNSSLLIVFVCPTVTVWSRRKPLVKPETLTPFKFLFFLVFKESISCCWCQSDDYVYIFS